MTPVPLPPIPGNWQPIPELTDDFDGDRLDPAKWHDHNPTWLGREPGYFSPANVSLSDGKLHLAAKVEDLPDLPPRFHTFTTAAVQSKATVLYGYFEARCRTMNSRACNAFWLYAQDPPPPPCGKTQDHDCAVRQQIDWWTEIDVFEITGRPSPRHPQWDRQIHMAAHVFATPQGVREHQATGDAWVAPWRPADDFHLYALEWNRDVLRYYVDGVPRYTIKNAHWHQPLHIDFNVETKADWFGLPDKDELPALFSIDHIRSWRSLP